MRSTGQELQNVKKIAKVVSWDEGILVFFLLLSLAVWCNAKVNNFLSCPNRKSFAVHFETADESRWTKEQKILNTNSKKRNVLIIQQKKTWFCFYWEPVRKPKFFSPATYQGLCWHACFSLLCVKTIAFFTHFSLLVTSIDNWSMQLLE
jgi:hypothetical protein